MITGNGGTRSYRDEAAFVNADRISRGVDSL
jgi:hypothetical protein